MIEAHSPHTPTRRSLPFPASAARRGARGCVPARFQGLDRCLELLGKYVVSLAVLCEETCVDREPGKGGGAGLQGCIPVSWGDGHPMKELAIGDQRIGDCSSFECLCSGPQVGRRGIGREEVVTYEG